MFGIMFLALSCLALSSSAALPDDVARIKAAQAQRERAVRTAKLDERVVIRRKTAPGEVEQSYNASMEAIDRLVEKTAALPNERAREQVADQIAQLLASVDAELVIRQLNKSVELRRKSLIDFEGGRARHEGIDLRSVDKLAADYGLSDDDRLSLDQSTTLIHKRGESIRLLPGMDRLALLTSGRKYRNDAERLKFGLIPEHMFTSGCELTVEPGSDDSSIRLVGRATGAADASPRFVAVLNRESGFLLTRFTHFDDSGAALVDFVASDFRPAGSIEVPFRTVLTLAGKGIADYRVETRTVESVSINVPVDDASFEVPADFRVQDFRRPKRAAGEPSNAQGAGGSGTDQAEARQDGAKKTQDEAKQPERDLGSGAAPGAGQPEREARPVQKNADAETSKRTIVIDAVDAEDEWQRYTREFIGRFKLHDGQSNSAWSILRDCQEQRAKYLASQRERIVQLRDRLSAKKSDEKGEKLLRKLDSFVRELEKLKRPIEEIFEKQLKPRLDKLPTRAQRAKAAKAG